ncbi:MAG: SUF system Fe-S cluster assembly protein [Alphaproteobacteria bacterium]|nr:SUF system Fe-S cluster assembly protein [Alphaproteobacteria bacterium]
MNHELGLHDFMPGAVGPDGMARAGSPLPPGAKVADEAVVIEAIKTVYDPEIPVNLYDLGLIYDLEIFDDGTVKIEMTLTAPACPVAGEIPKMVADAAAGADGVGEVEVRLVWDPPWTKARMSDEARLILDMF